MAGKRKFRVAFIVSELAKWKGQSVFDLFARSSHYDPFIVVIPYGPEFRLGPQELKKSQEEKISYFTGKGMVAISGLKNVGKETLNIDDLNADFVFYQQPWGPFGRLEPYRVCSRALTFYFPYYMLNNLDLDLEIGQDFHKFIFRYIVPSPSVSRLYESEVRKRQIRLCGSILPLGHPMMDRFYLEQKHSVGKGLVIYAPHWSITFGSFITKLKYSTFLENGREILSYAKKHPEIDWVFKPHPDLRDALITSGAMTEAEVDAYYDDWMRIAQTCYTADYVGLFLSARAIITDCGSFLTEFAATGRPIIRLLSHRITVPPHPSLRELYGTYYAVRNLDEMYRAFDAVLIRGEDPKGDERRKALESSGLLGTYAAKNILNYLNHLLKVSEGIAQCS